MNALYNAAMQLMEGGLRLAAPFHAKVGRMMAGRRRALPALRAALGAPHERGDRPVVWVHAASLGEFEQGRPLMERLRAEHPEARIVLSFFSPSGYEVRHSWAGADAVVYLPGDTRAHVRAFLDELRPTAAVFVKYEFWANHLQELHRRRIPTFIISAIFRPSQPFFKPWGALWRGMLRCFTQIFVQDEASLALLKGTGVTNALVCGDTRFDRVADVRTRPCHVPGLQKVLASCAMPFIAGSSWPEDEAVYVPWLCAHPEVKFVIAPHEFDASRIEALKASFPGRKVLALSELTHIAQSRGEDAPELEEVQGVVVDCFGLLSGLYRFGRVAYIGGGFGTGIHNINEAAVYGIPVIFGPRHAKFREAAGIISAGGGFSIASRAELQTLMQRLASEEALKQASEAAGAYIQANLGATARIYPYIENALFPPNL